MQYAPSEQTENFLARLDGVRRTSSGWMARCPCRNDDRNQSLSVSEGNDGRVLVTCHRGISCNVEQICDAVGLRVSDLMPKSDPTTPFGAEKKPRPAPPAAQTKPEKTYEKTTPPKFVEAYDYTDEFGKILFQKVRYVESDGRKTFRQRKPDGSGGWVYSLGDTPKVLYNLPNVLRAKEEGKPIWVVEGEKDANKLISLGIVATTMPGGAGKWLDIHTETLAGAYVEIVADRDDVGMKHAQDVCGILQAAGCNVQAWISPTKKDIFDHLSDGGLIEDLVPLEDEMAPQQASLDIQEEQPQPDVGELSPEELTIKRIEDVLAQQDLNAKQKIAKSNLILVTATVSHVLDTGRVVQWNDFIDESDNDTYEWVIPGLLERSERVIIVAAEGVGKTMLARQVAILSSHGIHPFTFQRMRPVRTLTVDLENPERIVRRVSRPIIAKAASRSGVKRIEGHLLAKPSGMDLLKAPDRLILEDALEKHKPELLVIGPLYKAFLDPGGRTSESIAIEVAKYLDTIRVVYNCALWIEHHAPLGATGASRDLRPFGSAVWSRWPEFGLALQPDPTAIGEYVYDVRHFRGARDERQWPIKMKRGKQFPFEVIEFMAVKDGGRQVKADNES